MQFASAVDKAISDNLELLIKPGVLSIRTGYQAAGQWLTKKPAIVVTVERKDADIRPQDRLPETVGGYAVDVREADPVQRLRGVNADLYAHVVSAARQETWRPLFPYERDARGQSLASLAANLTALSTAAKPRIDYTPPAGASLDPVEDDMTITVHASPDAGWPTLQPFLSGCQARMTIGMYDFTAPHIEAALISALAGRKLTLVLDHPPGNKNREQTIDQTVEDLKQAGNVRFDFAWALEGHDPKAAAAIFPNAYHIKVVVRDGQAFWLSSGNFNSTNQPDFDPVSQPQGAAVIARKSDRDWHVIVEHRGLATTFEKFLLNDYAVAAQHQAQDLSLSLGEVAAALSDTPLHVTPRAPKRYFPPQTISGRMRIQPVLTPDNYVQTILPLIQSATTLFYMQTQYIHLSPIQPDTTLARLVQAIAQKIAEGLDVRIIMSEFESLDKLEVLQAAGVDLSHVKIQAHVHNKGMIVDSRVAVVGSQNWSGDGVSRNRDASLIIYNEAAARYWREIFIHDWTNMAVQQALD